MEKVVYVLGAKKVGPFTDQSTGREINGTTVHYIEPVESTETNEIGFLPGSAFLKPEVFNQLSTNGAGFYTMQAELDLRSKKPKINILGFVFKEKGKTPFALEHAGK